MAFSIPPKFSLRETNYFTIKREITITFFKKIHLSVSVLVTDLFHEIFLISLYLFCLVKNSYHFSLRSSQFRIGGHITLKLWKQSTMSNDYIKDMAH